MTTRNKKTATAATAKAVRTEYVVLEEAPVVVQRTQTADEPVDAEIVVTGWLPVTELIGQGTKDAHWQVKVFTAPSKQAAIRRHTGEGANVLEGTWKAVPLSSWKGGETTRRVTAAERVPVTD
jgi:hypothetical protein